jgi:hypothetical protein
MQWSQEVTCRTRVSERVNEPGLAAYARRKESSGHSGVLTPARLPLRIGAQLLDKPLLGIGVPSNVSRLFLSDHGYQTSVPFL